SFIYGAVKLVLTEVWKIFHNLISPLDVLLLPFQTLFSLISATATIAIVLINESFLDFATSFYVFADLTENVISLFVSLQISGLGLAKSFKDIFSVTNKFTQLSTKIFGVFATRVFQTLNALFLLRTAFHAGFSLGTFLMSFDIISNAIATFIDYVAKAGNSFISTFASGIKSGGKILIDSIVGIFKPILDYLPHSNADKEPLNKLFESGIAFIKTIGEGIIKGASFIYDVIEFVFKSIWNIVKSKILILSDSRTFSDVGLEWAEFILIGFTATLLGGFVTIPSLIATFVIAHLLTSQDLFFESGQSLIHALGNGILSSGNIAYDAFISVLSMIGSSIKDVYKFFYGDRAFADIGLEWAEFILIGFSTTLLGGLVGFPAIANAFIMAHILTEKNDLFLGGQSIVHFILDGIWSGILSGGNIVYDAFISILSMIGSSVKDVYKFFYGDRAFADVGLEWAEFILIGFSTTLLGGLVGFPTIASAFIMAHILTEKNDLFLGGQSIVHFILDGIWSGIEEVHKVLVNVMSYIFLLIDSALNELFKDIQKEIFSDVDKKKVDWINVGLMLMEFIALGLFIAARGNIIPVAVKKVVLAFLAAFNLPAPWNQEKTIFWSIFEGFGDLIYEFGEKIVSQINSFFISIVNSFSKGESVLSESDIFKNIKIFFEEFEWVELGISIISMLSTGLMFAVINAAPFTPIGVLMSLIAGALMIPNYWNDQGKNLAQMLYLGFLERLQESFQNLKKDFDPTTYLSNIGKIIINIFSTQDEFKDFDPSKLLGEFIKSTIMLLVSGFVQGFIGFVKALGNLIGDIYNMIGVAFLGDSENKEMLFSIFINMFKDIGNALLDFNLIGVFEAVFIAAGKIIVNVGGYLLTQSINSLIIFVRDAFFNVGFLLVGFVLGGLQTAFETYWADFVIGFQRLMKRKDIKQFLTIFTEIQKSIKTALTKSLPKYIGTSFEKFGEILYQILPTTLYNYLKATFYDMKLIVRYFFESFGIDFSRIHTGALAHLKFLFGVKYGIPSLAILLLQNILPSPGTKAYKVLDKKVRKNTMAHMSLIYDSIKMFQKRESRLAAIGLVYIDSFISGFAKIFSRSGIPQFIVKYMHSAVIPAIETALEIFVAVFPRNEQKLRLLVGNLIIKPLGYFADGLQGTLIKMGRASPMQMFFNFLRRLGVAIPIVLGGITKTIPVLGKIFHILVTYVFSGMTALSSFNSTLIKTFNISLPLIGLFVELYFIYKKVNKVIEDSGKAFNETGKSGLELLDGMSALSAVIGTFFQILTDPEHLKRLLLVVSALMAFSPALAGLSIGIWILSFFTKEISSYIDAITIWVETNLMTQKGFEDLILSIKNSINKFSFKNFIDNFINLREIVNKTFKEFDYKKHIEDFKMLINEYTEAEKIFSATLFVIQGILATLFSTQAFKALNRFFPEFQKFNIGFSTLLGMIILKFGNLKEAVFSTNEAVVETWKNIGENGQKIFTSLGFEIINIFLAASFHTLLPVFIGLARVVLAFRKEIVNLGKAISYLWEHSSVFRYITYSMLGIITLLVLSQTVIVGIGAGISAAVGTLLGAIATYHDEIINFFDMITNLPSIIGIPFLAILGVLAFFVAKFIASMIMITKARAQAAQMMKKNPILLAFGVDQKNLENNILKASRNANTIFGETIGSCNSKGIGGCVEGGVKKGIAKSKKHTKNWIGNLFGSPKTLSNHISIGISGGISKGMKDASFVAGARERAKELRGIVRLNKLEIEKLEKKMARTISSSEALRFKNRIERLKEENRIKSSALREQQGFISGEKERGVISSFIKGGKGAAKSAQPLDVKDYERRLISVQKRIDDYNKMIVDLHEKRFSTINKKSVMEQIKNIEANNESMFKAFASIKTSSDRAIASIDDDKKGKLKKQLKEREQILGDMLKIEERQEKLFKTSESGKVKDDYIKEVNKLSTQYENKRVAFQTLHNNIFEESRISADEFDRLNKNSNQYYQIQQGKLKDLNVTFDTLSKNVSTTKAIDGIEKQIEYSEKEIAMLEHARNKTHKFNTSRLDQIKQLIQINKNESEHLRLVLGTSVGEGIGDVEKNIAQKQKDILDRERKKLRTEMSDLEHEMRSKADKEFATLITKKTKEPGWFSKFVLREKQMYAVDVIQQHQQQIRNMYEKSKKDVDRAPLIDRLRKTKIELNGVRESLTNITSELAKKFDIEGKLSKIKQPIEKTKGKIGDIPIFTTDTKKQMNQIDQLYDYNEKRTVESLRKSIELEKQRIIEIETKRKEANKKIEKELNLKKLTISNNIAEEIISEEVKFKNIDEITKRSFNNRLNLIAQAKEEELRAIDNILEMDKRKYVENENDINKLNALREDLDKLTLSADEKKIADDYRKTTDEIKKVNEELLEDKQLLTEEHEKILISEEKYQKLFGIYKDQYVNFGKEEIRIGNKLKTLDDQREESIARSGMLKYRAETNTKRILDENVDKILKMQKMSDRERAMRIYFNKLEGKQLQLAKDFVNEKIIEKERQQDINKENEKLELINQQKKEVESIILKRKSESLALEKTINTEYENRENISNKILLSEQKLNQLNQQKTKVDTSEEMKKYIKLQRNAIELENKLENDKTVYENQAEQRHKTSITNIENRYKQEEDMLKSDSISKMTAYEKLLALETSEMNEILKNESIKRESIKKTFDLKREAIKIEKEQLRAIGTDKYATKANQKRYTDFLASEEQEQNFITASEKQEMKRLAEKVKIQKTSLERMKRIRLDALETEEALMNTNDKKTVQRLEKNKIIAEKNIKDLQYKQSLMINEEENRYNALAQEKENIAKKEIQQIQEKLNKLNNEMSFIEKNSVYKKDELSFNDKISNVRKRGVEEVGKINSLYQERSNILKNIYSYKDIDGIIDREKTKQEQLINTISQKRNKSIDDTLNNFEKEFRKTGDMTEKMFDKYKQSQLKSANELYEIQSKEIKKLFSQRRKTLGKQFQEQKSITKEQKKSINEMLELESKLGIIKKHNSDYIRDEKSITENFERNKLIYEERRNNLIAKSLKSQESKIENINKDSLKAIQEKEKEIKRLSDQQLRFNDKFNSTKIAFIEKEISKIKQINEESIKGIRDRHSKVNQYLEKRYNRELTNQQILYSDRMSKLNETYSGEKALSKEWIDKKKSIEDKIASDNLKRQQTILGKLVDDEKQSLSILESERKERINKIGKFGEIKKIEELKSNLSSLKDSLSKSEEEYKRHNNQVAENQKTLYAQANKDRLNSEIELNDKLLKERVRLINSTARSEIYALGKARLEKVKEIGAKEPVIEMAKTGGYKDMSIKSYRDSIKNTKEYYKNIKNLILKNENEISQTRRNISTGVYDKEFGEGRIKTLEAENLKFNRSLNKTNISLASFVGWITGIPAKSKIANVGIRSLSKSFLFLAGTIGMARSMVFGMALEMLVFGGMSWVMEHWQEIIEWFVYLLDVAINKIKMLGDIMTSDKMQTFVRDLQNSFSEFMKGDIGEVLKNLFEDAGIASIYLVQSVSRLVTLDLGEFIGFLSAALNLIVSLGKGFLYLGKILISFVFPFELMGLGNVANDFNDFKESMLDAHKAIGEMLGIPIDNFIDRFVDAFLKLESNILILIGTIGFLIYKFTPFGKILTAFIGLFNLLPTTKVTTFGMGLFRILKILTPFGIAFTVLLSTFYNFSKIIEGVSFEKFEELGKKLTEKTDFRKIKESWNDLTETFSRGFGFDVKSSISKFSEYKEKVNQLIKEIKDSIPDNIKEIFSRGLNFDIEETIKENKLFESGKLLFNGFVKGIKSSYTDIETSINYISDETVRLSDKMISSIKEMKFVDEIQNIFSRGFGFDISEKILTDKTTQIINNFSMIVINGLAQLTGFDSGEQLVDTFIDGIKSAFNPLKDLINKLTEMIASFFPHSDPEQGALRNLTDMGRSLITTFIDGIKQ
ncbi:hypothetical protein KY334_00790, partial [Candidatus Woesearchaeota archaeon]|nr:hypothetical protein [Candidatus Woesearchaeota archaeon]